MAAVKTDRLYRGERMKDATVVTVHVAPGEHRPLGGDDAPGFDWGRPTPGALALTDALAADVFGDSATPGLRERLFHDVVLRLPFIEPWVVWHAALEEWAERQPAGSPRVAG
jgi:hypothetical protein